MFCINYLLAFVVCSLGHYINNLKWEKLNNQITDFSREALWENYVRMFVLNIISFLNKLLLKYYRHLGTQTIPQLINTYSISKKYKKQIFDW